jgi:hypothetical protein
VLTTNKMMASQIWIPSNQERILSAAPSEDPNGTARISSKTRDGHDHCSYSSDSRVHADGWLANHDAYGDSMQSC